MYYWLSSLRGNNFMATCSLISLDIQLSFKQRNFIIFKIPGIQINWDFSWMPHENIADFVNQLEKKLGFFLFVIRNIRMYVVWNIGNQGCFNILFDIYASSVRVFLGYTVLLDFESKKEIL